MTRSRLIWTYWIASLVYALAGLGTAAASWYAPSEVSTLGLIIMASVGVPMYFYSRAMFWIIRNTEG